jgi:hypothetical protein
MAKQSNVTTDVNKGYKPALYGVITIVIAMPTWLFIFVLIGHFILPQDPDFVLRWYAPVAILAGVCLYTSLVLSTIFVVLRALGLDP